MSERHKLYQSWELKKLQGQDVLVKDMLIELAKLVESCPHTKTHWIQELSREGFFSPVIYKRCYLCGYNIDELEADSEFSEQLLDAFDKSCEERKKGKEK